MSGHYTQGGWPGGPLLPTHLPPDLDAALTAVMGDREYAVYVLDGQTADLTGAEEDWHDALVLVVWPTDYPSDADLAEQVVRFTRDPDGDITYWYPNRPNDEPRAVGAQA